MKSSDALTDIRSVQQYLYCPHRWGLMEIVCSWAENAFVCKGNLVHESVDTGKCLSARNAIVERSVRVYNDEWGLFGVIDCLELRRSVSGCFIEKYGERFELTIVEYKVRSPKTGDFPVRTACSCLLRKSVRTAFSTPTAKPSFIMRISAKGSEPNSTMRITRF